MALPHQTNASNANKMHNRMSSTGASRTGSSGAAALPILPARAVLRQVDAVRALAVGAAAAHVSACKTWCACAVLVPLTAHELI